MAKFKASPFYSVYVPSGKANFDHNGEYETTSAEDIAVLKALSPRYLTCLDEGKAAEPAATKQTEAPAKPKAPARKSSAK